MPQALLGHSPPGSGTGEKRPASKADTGVVAPSSGLHVSSARPSASLGPGPGPRVRAVCSQGSLADLPPDPASETVAATPGPCSGERGGALSGDAGPAADPRGGHVHGGSLRGYPRGAVGVSLTPVGTVRRGFVASHRLKCRLPSVRCPHRSDRLALLRVSTRHRPRCCHAASEQRLRRRHTAATLPCCLRDTCPRLSGRRERPSRSLRGSDPGEGQVQDREVKADLALNLPGTALGGVLVPLSPPSAWNVHLTAGARPATLDHDLTLAAAAALAGAGGSGTAKDPRSVGRGPVLTADTLSPAPGRREVASSLLLLAGAPLPLHAG